MPKLFRIGSYIVFFWSNENGEPIHVHVSQGNPGPNTTKLWLTASGHCVLANNQSRIPAKDLNDIMDVVSAQFLYICSQWKAHFAVDKIKFYC